MDENDSDGVVYVIGELSLLPVGGGRQPWEPLFVKIGWATPPGKGPRRRLSQLQIGNRFDLSLLVIYGPTTREAEAEAHKAFAASRVRGEWFRLGRDALLDRFVSAVTHDEAIAVWEEVRARCKDGREIPRARDRQ